MFGLMRRSTHERLIAEEKTGRIGDLIAARHKLANAQADHALEVSILRGEIVGLRNELSIARGQLVAERHAKGKIG